MNGTDLEKADKIAKVIAHHLFEYDTLTVLLTYMPPQMESVGDIDLQAYVVKAPKDHFYSIFLSRKLKSSELKKTLCHEFVHIRQMEKGDLIQFPPDKMMSIWKGDTIDYKLIPYDQRPEELEAFNLDDRILRDLEKIWYK
jgi:hypothetical protein